ncbi:hypothetical protein ACO3VM_01605 [Methanocaldococcus sp. 10A]
MGVALFLSNVGDRDLGKNNVPLFDFKEHREESEKLREYCEEIYKKITGKELKYKGNIYEFTKELYSSGVYRELYLEPIIIKPKIKKILEFHDYVDVVLFGTLQTTGHKSDAFFTACIIEYLLKKEFGDRIKNIKVCAVIDNPSDYALMFDYYKKVLGFFDNENYEAIYLGVTGGTAGLSFGLITNGVIKWESKVKILYKSPYKKDVNEIKIGEKIFKLLKSKEFEAFKKSYLYDLAAEYVKKYKLTENYEFEYYYLKGLNYKKLFDFKSAEEMFNEALNYANLDNRKKILEELEILKEFSKEPKNLEDRIKKYSLLINLLIDNAKMKWETGEYVDFIGRLFRIEEALLRLIFEKEFNISTDKEGAEEFKRFLNENEDIVNYIKKKFDLEELKLEANRKVLLGILGYLVEINGKGKEYGRIYSILKRIENLSDLRNNTIIAHGFSGISEKDITEKYKNKIIDDLIKLKEFIKSI